MERMLESTRRQDGRVNRFEPTLFVIRITIVFFVVSVFLCVIDSVPIDAEIAEVTGVLQPCVVAPGKYKCATRLHGHVDPLVEMDHRDLSKPFVADPIPHWIESTQLNGTFMLAAIGSVNFELEDYDLNIVTDDNHIIVK